MAHKRADGAPAHIQLPIRKKSLIFLQRASHDRAGDFPTLGTITEYDKNTKLLLYLSGRVDVLESVIQCYGLLFFSNVFLQEVYSSYLLQNGKKPFQLWRSSMPHSQHVIVSCALQDGDIPKPIEWLLMQLLKLNSELKSLMWDFRNIARVTGICLFLSQGLKRA